ncbi:MAG TPA: energy-coupling factor ABC transporter permease [Verrucomicrobiae bacterium]|nr:energy-coupling factor ABC transporter permease [Verrucomicrobiae bacterium]
MHIPDGFLDAKTAMATAGLAAGGLAIALRQVRRQLPRRKIPLLGLAAAFVFAAQMLNFPVAGGTSGHFVGGVLTAVLLGPSAAVVVLASVLIVQCFLFADGGVTALGANVFNMGLIGGVVGYAIYRLVRRVSPGTRGVVMAAAFAAWCSTVLAAIVCAGELALSGTVAWPVAFPAMANVHMLIGIGEGVITALVIVAIARARPELLEQSVGEHADPGFGTVLVFGLVISFGLALFVAPFACSWPDGLDKVAKTLGFEHRAAGQPLLHSPIPVYQLPGVSSAAVATALAGAIGTVVVFALAFLLARLLVPGPAADRN